MKSRRLKRIVGTVAVLAVLLWIGYVWTWHVHLRPSNPSITLREFVVSMPPARIVERIEIDNVRYTRLTGTAPPAAVLASGPPVYIFDEKGVLAAWTSDIGDDDEFCRRWTGSNIEPTTIEEIMQEMH